jgi:pimeloyl-ACP methyl ester carboxylesterase
MNRHFADTDSTRLTRRSAIRKVAAAGAAIALTTSLETLSSSAQETASPVGTDTGSTQEESTMTDATPSPGAAQPTVVLVHGAFADGSSWNEVITRLQAARINVKAIPNPLRGIAHDSAYVASAVAQIPGPVLLAGHSYAGAVISNAARGAGNVTGLVFVAAFAPDEGEILGEVAATSKDAILGAVQIPLNYPNGADGSTAVEFVVDPAHFHEAFAADLPVEQAAVLAATQRPVAQAAFTEVSGPAAWKSLPSWAVVATADKAAGTDIVRSMAERAGAQITEIDGSHVIMISQPQAVTEVILSALQGVA